MCQIKIAQNPNKWKSKFQFSILILLIYNLQNYKCVAQDVIKHNAVMPTAVYLWEIRNSTQRHHCKMSLHKINSQGRFLTTIFYNI